MLDQSKSSKSSPSHVTRPQMPQDYGILSESEGSGLIPWSHVTERFATSHNYWIHTTRVDGLPHAKPVWGIWLEDRFYFSTSTTSVDGKNISTKHSITVHLESGDDVAILEGTAEAIADSSILSRLDDAYYAKYAFHLVQGNSGSVYMVRPKVAFAWLERDFVGSATRYTFTLE